MGDLKFLFVGGPGRSGTSVFSQQLIEHPEIVGFFDVELKLYCEVDGLIDLYNSFGPYFSPNRSEMAVRRLRYQIDALFQHASDQVSLGLYIDKPTVIAEFDAMIARLGYPERMRRVSDDEFFTAARSFSDALARLSRRQPGKANATVFLEKTPHVLLQLPFLSRLHKEATLIHVMRDPRAVAHSLMRMPWGPNALGDCIAWVNAYWMAFETSRAFARSNNLRLVEMYTEEIAARPVESAVFVCDVLSVPALNNLFGWSDVSRLNAWTEKASAEDLALLDAGLGDLAANLGYDRSLIGVRRP